MIQEWYYAPGGADPGGADTWQTLPHDIIRVRLTADWQTCDDGAGVMLSLDDSGNVVEGRIISLRDPTGIIAGHLLADPLNLSMSKGTCLWVIATYDGPVPSANSPYYEPFNFGQCCAGSGSVGGSESGGSEGSGSGCSYTPSHFGFAHIDGYNEHSTQVLGHDHGCMKWITVAPCNSSGSGSV